MPAIIAPPEAAGAPIPSAVPRPRAEPSAAGAYTENVRVRRALLTLIALAAVAVAGTSMIRTVRGFFRLDFTVTWIAEGVRVDRVPAASSARLADLRPGDLIVSVDAVPIARLADPLFVLAAGEEHRLTVHDRGGEVRDVVYRPPSPVVDPVYLARSTVGLVAVLCALMAVWTTTRREGATFLLLAAAALLMGAIPFRTAATAEGLRMLHRLSGAAVPLLLVRFFAIFPERRHSMRLWDALTVVVTAASVSMAVSPQLEPWWPAAASILRVVFGLAITVGTIIYVRRWRSAARLARVRRQIEWAALGMFVGLAPYLILVLIPRGLGIVFDPFSWLMVLPMAAVPAGFLAALTGYRLWDLEPIARDSLSATLVVVTGGFIFLLTNDLLLNYARGLGALRNLLAFATGVLLVVLLQPVRQQVEHFLDRLLHHGRPTPRALLTQSTRELVSATDPRDLLRRLSHTLHEGLEFERVSTYLRNADGGFVRVTGTDGVAPELPGNVLQQQFPGQGEQELAATGHALRIPLTRVGTVHGLLYLGLRRGIFPLGSEGREVVEAFAAQAALGLESARHLDDLRRQAEEYRILHANTQRIIESSAAAILVCDASGRILSTNTEAADIFEMASQALVGRGLDELVELPSSWLPHLPLHAVNAEARTRSEPPRRVILAVSVLELDSGSFNGRVVVLQDVTELRELQDRMREQERLAALGRLASGLAHEINTPLTGIASFAQMLGEMTAPGDPRAPLVDKLVNQSFRVSRIVANLHEAVRGSRAERQPVDLGEVVGRASRDASRSVGAEERLEVVLPEARVTAWGAAGPLEVAVSNLVRNAFEASPSGGRVEVAVSAVDGWAEVDVDDSGPGVPEELREKVFEPFFSTKTERGGTGLGLAITRDMITQLGGDIRVGRSPSGGARVTLRLKLWQASEPSS